MNKYNVLLLDADDTLLDFHANEYQALGNLFEKMGYQINHDIRNEYKRINHSLWRQYENGEISKEEIVNTRFHRLFDAIGMKEDGMMAENIYRLELGKGSQLIPGALEVCERLCKYCDLYIITNGVYETQIKRLKNSGLNSFIKNSFISDAIGYQKPSLEFFRYVLNHIGSVELDEILIVGDSLSSDIRGGKIAGIDTCWFNPQKNQNNTDIIPNYEISELRELLTLN